VRWKDCAKSLTPPCHHPLFPALAFLASPLVSIRLLSFWSGGVLVTVISEKLSVAATLAGKLRNWEIAKWRNGEIGKLRDWNSKLRNWSWHRSWRGCCPEMRCDAIGCSTYQTVRCGDDNESDSDSKAVTPTKNPPPEALLNCPGNALDNILSAKEFWISISKEKILTKGKSSSLINKFWIYIRNEDLTLLRWQVTKGLLISKNGKLTKLWYNVRIYFIYRGITKIKWFLFFKIANDLSFCIKLRLT